ncbi:MAG: DNA-directed RNA polymerase subunit H [Methanomassiliicoccaceae archaeon]|nr:DNA-directed RNA polymerase subunit H [Methanomassiliicoccaceae archaeon]
MATDNISFNVLKHDLVPEHHLLNDEEAKTILTKLKVTCDQLPKIRKSDPGIRVLENIYGPVEEGRIVKIVRKSETAEEFVVYRLVTRG